MRLRINQALLVGLALLTFAFAFAFAVGAREAFGEDTCKGSALGYQYPVVIKGASELVGISVTRFAAYSRRSSVWTRVPVQVDEVNKAGDYVLEEGMPFTARTGDGIYGSKDELVFEGASLGDDFAQGEIPDAVSKMGSRFWHLKICRMGAFLGSLLLVESLVSADRNADPRSVTFNRESATVRSGLYRYQFHGTNPVLLGQVFLRRGKDEFPVLADSSFKMPLRLPWWLPNFTLGDDDFKSMIECWRVGPVRSIIAVGVKFKSFLSVLNLHLFSELVFYRNMFQIPTMIEFVFDPRSYLLPGSGIFYALSFPQGRAWDILTNLEELPKKSATRALETQRRAADPSEVFFAAGHRPEGSFLVNVRVDPAARRQVSTPYIVRRPMFGPSSPWSSLWPWLSESHGDLGVYLEFSRIRKGLYSFGLDLFLSSNAKDEFADFGATEKYWSVVNPPTPAPKLR